MRTIMACAALAVLGVAYALAEETAPAKPAVTDTTVINLCGSRLAKMFAQCGTPVDLRVKRGSTPAEDDVLCDYGSFAFRVRNKMVRVCFIWEGWTGKIKGIRLGDTRQQVVKVLGVAPTTDKDKNGVVTDYGYDLKELDADMFVNFDKDGKVWRVEVSLKE